MTDLLPQLKERISSKISQLNFNTWFQPVSAARLTDNAVVLTVPNKFIADWINDYYLDLLRQEVLLLTGETPRVAYEFSDPEQAHLPAAAPEPQAPATTPAEPRPRVRIVPQLNEKYTFDRFIVGNDNQFAVAGARAVAELPGGNYNPLFLYGGTGLGKTHLLHAIGLDAIRRRAQLSVIYVSGENFMNELINSLRYERMPDFRKKYRESCDILLVDDVQFIAGKERTQEEFFHTFNALHEARKQIVMTSDKFPKDMQGLDQRLCSRFEWGLIADIQPPDLETRIAILKKKAESDRLSCPDDVAMYLAGLIKSNVRELEGALIRVNAFASLTGARLTVDFVRETLKQTQRDSTTDRTCTIESIQKTVAAFYQLNVSDLKSQRRMRQLAHPRQVAMYLCKKLSGQSFPEIGNKFGGKDHTTVMHACKKIERLLSSDHNLQQDIAALERQLLH